MLDEKYFRLFKESLNVDFDEKDEELRFLLQSSLEFCVGHTNRSEDEIRDMGEGDFPLNFIHAVVILARHWWETGGTMVSGSLRDNPAGFDALLNPFIRFE